MQNSDYWAKRFKALEERTNSEAEKCIAESLKLINDEVIQIDKDITYWLKRFAINNNITLAEARKTISNKDFEELGWDVEEYIKRGINNSYTGEWTTELENASANYHISRLEAIKLQIQKHCDTAFKGVVDKMAESLEKTYKDIYYRTAFEVQKGIDVGYSFAMVDENKLKMILEKPWAVDGSNFSQRVWGSYRPKLTNKLQQALTSWCTQGADPKKLAKKLSRESNIAQSATKRLIQTETAQICSRAEKDSYKELGVEKYSILAALDSKTCEICGDMDGKIFASDDFQVGVTAPPFHPSCRCTTVPEVDDDLLTQGRKRAARDKNGKTVYVKDMTYKQWKENFVSSDQFTKSSNSDIIKSITIDNFKPIYEKGTISKECIDEIYNALNNNGRYFNKVDIINVPRHADGKIDLLRTNITPSGNWADATLEINEAFFKGKTLEEVNNIIIKNYETGHCVMQNLKEAVWHEIGHAKIMYGETYARAEAITDLLNDYHIDGISKTALQNGDECIAECYVLKMRGEKIPEQAQQIYNEYIKE